METTSCNIPDEAMYIEYPVSLLQDLNKISLDEIHNVLWFGLYKASLDVDYCMEQVIEYTLTSYYADNKGNSVSLFLHQLNLSLLRNHKCLEDFSDAKITVFHNKIFKVLPELEADAIELYQMSVILKFYKLLGHAESFVKKGKELFALHKSEQLLYFHLNELLFLKKKFRL